MHFRSPAVKASGWQVEVTVRFVDYIPPNDWESSKELAQDLSILLWNFHQDDIRRPSHSMNGPIVRNSAWSWDQHKAKSNYRIIGQHTLSWILCIEQLLTCVRTLETGFLPCFSLIVYLGEARTGGSTNTIWSISPRSQRRGLFIIPPWRHWPIMMSVQNFSLRQKLTCIFRIPSGQFPAILSMTKSF